MASREASCSCGALRVRVDGEPVRVSICHCLACQQRTGSVFGAQARFPRSVVTITGESRVFERFSDDGEPRRHHFCPQCGSTVYWSPEPEYVAVAVGAFAEPGFPAPSVSVWEERKHSWVIPPADAQRID